MSFLLDTNVVSEWIRPRPNPGVVNWMEEVDEDRVFLSVVTLAELRHGIERMPLGSRQTRLDLWLREELPVRFDGRILPVNAPIAIACGKLTARNQMVGRPMAAMDGFLAATAEVHGLTMVTRNIGHFAILGPAVLNPWMI